MATVYLAQDPLFKRDVAVKVLPREFLHDPTFRARFQREAQTIASLEHPAIVPVYDFGEEQGQPYLVMRYMAGGSLADRLRRGRLALEEAVAILSRLAPALDAAHRQGVVHRDLKPGNILFDRWNEAYISDFGIAKLAESGGATITATGMTVGTPAYMSPEQVTAGGELDGRSDLYALGVIFFEMLTGEQPYQATTPMAVAVKHITEPVPRIQERNQALPASCQPIIEKALAKDRAQRFQTAAELAAVSQRLVQPVPAPAPPQPVAAPPPVPPTLVAPPPRPATVDQAAVTVVDAAPATVDRAANGEAAGEGRTGAARARVQPAPRRPSGRLVVAGALLAGLAVMAVAGLAVLWLVYDRLSNPTPPGEGEPSLTAPNTIAPFIEEKWDEGFDVTNLAFGRSSWAVVMAQQPAAGRQSLWRQAGFPSQFVEEKWSEGFAVTSLAFGDRQWAVVMSQAADDERQALQRQPDFPSAFVDQKWGEGFDLTGLAYGGGQWVVVMTQAALDRRQSLWRQADFPSQFVEEKWAEGFAITGLAFGDGQWVVVMSEEMQDVRQSLWRQPEFPGPFVQTKWAEGFDLAQIAFGDGQWVVVMSEGNEDERQTLQVGGW
jgi:serine/threonine-protein kinase